MRLIKFILSSIVFIVTFFIILAAQYATSTIITAPGTLPGDGDSAIERVHLFPDPSESDITYTDALDFWSLSVNQSLETASEMPSYSIRGWFDWDWWYQNMEWADSIYSYGKAIVVPAIAPIYEIKEMYVYYGRDIYDESYAELFAKQFGQNIVYSGTVDDYLVGNYENLSRDQYQFLYNLEVKLYKYNAVNEEGVPVYKEFVEKFINYDGDLNGEYEFQSVNAVSAFLFYQLFLAVVLSLYFTYQNPIVISRNGSGENEVEGRVLPKLPFRFSKRPNKQNKSKKGA
jgi:hypothetical protein